MTDYAVINPATGEHVKEFPTITDDELAYFTDLKVNQLKSSRTIENWVGMLIASVPVYFEGNATELHRYRKQKAAETEQGKETARIILADPEASDAEREWARTLLATTS